MSDFDPGFSIEVIPDTMDFRFGEGSFGSKPEKRSLDSIRKSLMDPGCEGPDPVYSIVMDVGKEMHRRILDDLHLLFGVVTFAGGKLGMEPVRSQGHLHRRSEHANGWSTPELYEIWEGEAIIYMQETAEDDPGRCFAVKAGPGDVVLVPPGWAHMTVNTSVGKPMTFGAWCDREYGFEYEMVRAHEGLAWYPMTGNEGSIEWKANPNYLERPLKEKPPRIYSEFCIDTNLPVYAQFEKDPERFLFIPRPDEVPEKWIKFIP